MVDGSVSNGQEYLPRAPPRFAGSCPAPTMTVSTFFRPPAWLKRRLLPAWNRAHLPGSRDLDAGRGRRSRSSPVRRPSRLLRSDSCRCSYRPDLDPGAARRAVGPLASAEGTRTMRKESLSCASCGAKLRARRMAVGDPRPLSRRAVPCRFARRLGDPSLRLRATPRGRAEPDRRPARVAGRGSRPSLTTPSSARGQTPGSEVDGIRRRGSDGPGRIPTTRATSSCPRRPSSTARTSPAPWGRSTGRWPGGVHVFTMPVSPGVPRHASPIDARGPTGRPSPGDADLSSRRGPGISGVHRVRRTCRRSWKHRVEVDVRFGPTTRTTGPGLRLAGSRPSRETRAEPPKAGPAGPR